MTFCRDLVSSLQQASSQATLAPLPGISSCWMLLTWGSQHHAAETRHPLWTSCTSMTTESAHMEHMAAVLWYYSWFILKWLSAGIWWQPYDDARARAAVQRPHCLRIYPVSKFTWALSQLICRSLTQTSDHVTSNYSAGSTNGSCTFVYMGWVLISEHFLCFTKTDSKAKTKEMWDLSNVTQTFYDSCSNCFIYDSLSWSQDKICLTSIWRSKMEILIMRFEGQRCF